MNKVFESYDKARDYFMSVYYHEDNDELYTMIFDKEDQVYRVISEDVYKDYRYCWDLDMDIIMC